MMRWAALALMLALSRLDTPRAINPLLLFVLLDDNFAPQHTWQRVDRDAIAAEIQEQGRFDLSVICLVNA